MSERFNNIQWVVQDGVGQDSGYVERLQSSCKQLGIRCEVVSLVPFDPKLPDFDRSYTSIFYGSTSLYQLAMKGVALTAGVFMDYTAFSMENYFLQWGMYMLNYGSPIMTFERLLGMNIQPEMELFVRPDSDQKAFNGMVKRFDEIGPWVEGTDLLSTKIVVSQPYHLKYEWRLWIVDKRVVAATRYRQDFKPSKEPGCPQEVKDFAEQRCREYTPAPVFVMDICLCGDSYYIIECGCFNAAGFYAADVDDIVREVSGYLVKG